MAKTVAMPEPRPGPFQRSPKICRVMSRWEISVGYFEVQLLMEWCAGGSLLPRILKDEAVAIA